MILEASDGDLTGRQSFYGQENPTTHERMLQYEAHAGPLAAARRPAVPSTRPGSSRDA